MATRYPSGEAGLVPSVGVIRAAPARRPPHRRVSEPRWARGAVARGGARPSHASVFGPAAGRRIRSAARCCTRARGPWRLLGTHPRLSAGRPARPAGQLACLPRGCADALTRQACGRCGPQVTFVLSGDRHGVYGVSVPAHVLGSGQRPPRPGHTRAHGAMRLSFCAFGRQIIFTRCLPRRLRSRPRLPAWAMAW